MERIDVAIIGGGILGWTLAHLLSKSENLHSGVILSSADFHSASLHNQSWLQSGLLYDLDNRQGEEEATRCMMYGRKIPDLQNVPFRSLPGVMALANEAQAKKKLAFLEKYGYSAPQALIDRREAERLLGKDFYKSPQFTPDTCFIRTPDQTFKEGAYLRFCENSLGLAGFPFQSLRGVAQLIKNTAARNGYSVRVNGREFDPATLFIAAGVSTKRILEPLGLSDKINIGARRCVLFKAPFDTDLRADVFMDKLSKINVNLAETRRGEKTWLFGDILNSPVADLFTAPPYPSVRAQDKEEFIRNFCDPNHYPHLRTKLEPFLKNDANFSVCFKTEIVGHLPWISDSNELGSEFRNIYIAGPGKATLAWFTAHELLQRTNLLTEVGPAQSRSIPSISEIQQWSETN
jgi:FAD dependent oxidoreductase